jgi:hypothetical protein
MVLEVMGSSGATVAGIAGIAGNGVNLGLHLSEDKISTVNVATDVGECLVNGAGLLSNGIIGTTASVGTLVYGVGRLGIEIWSAKSDLDNVNNRIESKKKAHPLRLKAKKLAGIERGKAIVAKAHSDTKRRAEATDADVKAQDKALEKRWDEQREEREKATFTGFVTRLQLIKIAEEMMNVSRRQEQEKERIKREAQKLKERPLKLGSPPPGTGAPCPLPALEPPPGGGGFDVDTAADDLQGIVVLS